jgi:hypothetical protein
MSEVREVFCVGRFCPSTTVRLGRASDPFDVRVVRVVCLLDACT